MNNSAPARSSGYHQKAMEEIHISLLPFAKSGGGSGSSVVGNGTVVGGGGGSSSGGGGEGSSAASTISNMSVTSGVSSMSSTSNGTNDKDLHHLRQMLAQLLSMGYSEDSSVRALQMSGGRLEGAIDYLLKQQGEPNPNKIKLMRKPSIERELGLHRGSPALDSGAGSSRSDSPRLPDLHPPATRQYSPSGFGDPPPPPPPRNTPPPPPPHGPYPSNVQQMFKRMSPAPVVPARAPPAVPGVVYSSQPSSQRGTSPVSSQGAPGRQPMVVQNGPQVQQQLTQQMQALSLYQSGGPQNAEPPPPYPLMAASPSGPPPPPSYSASIQSRQSPTQDFRKSPSSGIYSGSTSAGSPSPIPVSTTTPTSMPRPTPLQAWGARQAKTQPPIIMQSVKSTQVQKPVLQTAIAPTAPQIPSSPTSTTPPAAQPPPPSYNASIQQKQYGGGKPAAPLPSPASSGAVSVPTTEPPSYASTMQAKAKAVHRGMGHSPHPPPPYTEDMMGGQVTNTVESTISPRASPHIHQPLQRKYSPIVDRSDSPKSTASSNEGRPPCPAYADAIAPPLPPTASSSVGSKNTTHLMNGNSVNNNNIIIGDLPPQLPPHTKIKHQSPIPERKKISKEKEEERRDGKVKNYSPQAFKFFMEQHMENVIKQYNQRMYRRMQLENEMTKIGLSPEAQCQMRKMLSQKESNYIRLKRAKMDKTMFVKIKPIGVGAFGEVTLVRKIDTNHLYAMKTLRKADVLKRNQVAHVKAERDILAEADNEWVVKLYYSFQDSDILYFVMDYIPGGDLMSLLIKLGIFQEPLARFYIAELTCAVESVHKMGFIHRDIKPDNILIDKDGHIKLTDFGLCTGFRWTHNSKYYQPNEHARQDSMEPMEDWNEECRCKPLERRRRIEHQRCLAHSLVGTPNYIAPEVLQRTGYTQLCDWWSVGVILYEMLVGSPPFLANTPAETQYKVINWETTLHIPKEAKLSPEATDLILKLCCSSDKRIGKNANEVKSHPFFKDIDFDKGLRRQPAPHIPKIEYATDTSNFDPIDPDKLRNSNSLGSTDADDDPLDTSRPFHGFFEFTFRRFFDDGGGGPAFNRINLDNSDGDSQGPVYV